MSPASPNSYAESSVSAASVGSIVAHVLRRPRLYSSALRAAWRFRRMDWYRRPPFLPLPPPDYLTWRTLTAYGEQASGPTPRELERYLRWMEWMRRSSRKD